MTFWKTLVMFGLVAFGLANLALADTPPYVDSEGKPKTLYLRGTIINGDEEWWNKFEPRNTFKYLGNGKYELTVNLEKAEEQLQFKIADQYWGPASNFGAGDFQVTVGEVGNLEVGVSPGNVFVDIAKAGEYTFTFDASKDKNKPTILIKAK